MLVPTDAVNVKVAPDGGTMIFALDPAGFDRGRLGSFRCLAVQRWVG